MDAGTSKYKSVVIAIPGPSNRDISNVPITLNQVEFPTCFLSFPISTIADHTDSCGYVWVGDISEEKEGQILRLCLVTSLLHCEQGTAKRIPILHGPFCRDSRASSQHYPNYTERLLLV